MWAGMVAKPVRSITDLDTINAYHDVSIQQHLSDKISQVSAIIFNKEMCNIHLK